MSNLQVQKIRSSYEAKPTTTLDELKSLDKKVKRPAKIFAYVFGSLSSLVLGTGMCFAMKVIGATLSFAMPMGIGIGLLGILLVSINYPIYKKILNSRKAKYSARVFELSDVLLNEENA
ncbi:MAG: dihydropteridine reductase [Clostridia bacterium]|nr:dihydropteridine reductase [Clostridia bacterium]